MPTTTPTATPATEQAAPDSGRGRRAKWEAFWDGPRPDAEATHLLSVEIALELLGPESSPGRRRRVLDLGCGGGRVMELLQVVGFDVVGLDLAGGALTAARQYLGPEAHLVQGDAFRLPLADGSFDAILSLGYASVGSYPGVQGELARVLRPGGLALIDFRHLGLYHLPFVPTRGRRLLAAWRRGEVSCLGLGLRPAPSWSEAGLRFEAVRLFNTYPPVGRRLTPERCLAFERRVGRRLAPLLARTALARFCKD